MATYAKATRLHLTCYTGSGQNLYEVKSYVTVRRETNRQYRQRSVLQVYQGGRWRTLKDYGWAYKSGQGRSSTVKWTHKTSHGAKPRGTKYRLQTLIQHRPISGTWFPYGRGAEWRNKAFGRGRVNKQHNGNCNRGVNQTPRTRIHYAGRPNLLRYSIGLDTVTGYQPGTTQAETRYRVKASVTVSNGVIYRVSAMPTLDTAFPSANRTPRNGIFRFIAARKQLVYRFPERTFYNGNPMTRCVFMTHIEVRRGSRWVTVKKVYRSVSPNSNYIHVNDR